MITKQDYPHHDQGLSALSRCRHWIFDLDGTLTLPNHDFEKIRIDLGLPAGLSILEAIKTLPADRRHKVQAELNEIELEIAGLAQPQPDAARLLTALRGQFSMLGILTRNSETNATATLAACGLSNFFDPAFVIGRESCAPKPSPEGVEHLLSAWGIGPDAAALVGDYRFDLEAGRAAGVKTVYFDPNDTRLWLAHADFHVQSLAALSVVVDREPRPARSARASRPNADRKIR